MGETVFSVESDFLTDFPLEPEMIVDQQWNHRWNTGGTMNISTGGPPVVTTKTVDAASVVHRWDIGGTSVTTCRVSLNSYPGSL